AARAIAPTLEAHFARHIAAGRLRAPVEVSAPAASLIEALIDAAFWASLRREEGYAPKISLALVQPDRAPHPLLFERPLPLDAGALVRGAPGVERRGTPLGVGPRVANGEPGALEVGGTTRPVPPYCFVLEVNAPGLLVVKHQREEPGKFVNVV